MSAPPTPWTARPAISTQAVCAAAARTDPAIMTTQLGDEDLAGPDEVGEASAEEQEAAEDDHIGVEDPLELALREAQVLLHLGERDPDDRRVHDDHELCGGEHDKCPPAPGIDG